MNTIELSYYRLIEEIDRCNDIANPLALLRHVCETYNLKTAAYFGLNVSQLNQSSPYLVVTYSHEWVDHYKVRNYLAIDPVIRNGFTNLLPIEWSRFDVRGRKLRAFFGEASEFGIGNNGLTIPIRGRGSDRALFSLSSDAPYKEWQAQLLNLKRDFQMLAYHFHQTILRLEGADTPVVKLAPREIECLKWRASGKTNWETAQILGISEKTVRFYLNLAQGKLNATNTTHAVAKALNNNLLLVSQ